MKTIDWNTVNFHCSSLYSIMAGADRKTPMQVWEEACMELVQKEDRLLNMKKKDGPGADKLREAIEKLQMLVPILETQKYIESPLSDGCKTYLGGVYACEKYGKWSPSKDTGSKQTMKGNEVQEDALTLVSRLDKIYLKNNEERIKNEWFTGIVDSFEGERLLNATVVHDVKAPWDIETFFSYLDKDLPKQYYWQMQGYMSLTGAKIAHVHFCMINTPLHQIKSEADKLLRKMNVISELSPEYVEAEKRLFNNMTFDDMPLEDRRIKFTVERNDEHIELAKRQVERCRQYLVNFENLHLSGEEILPLIQNDAA